MRPVTVILRPLIAAAVLLFATACSVAVPAETAPAAGALRMNDETAVPEAGTRPLNPRPLNRAEQLLPKVNAQPCGDGFMISKDNYELW
ncbi:hypothetical protein ACFVWT_15385 [Arthrobacter sp. NPDC058288]|uniref:hypothetical protein n=1 Tax=Arthrobacter sp. NPDC058288 TaxID=3346424 RepID=UPI0036E8D8A3